MEKLLIDGFYGLEGGMNSALSPHLIEKNQYHVGFNVTARGGQIGTRPGFDKFAGQITNYRGGTMYTHKDGTVSFVYASGSSLQVLDASSAAELATATPGPTLSSSTGEVYFCEVGSYLVIQDGQNKPKVLRAGDSSSATWADVSSTYGNKLPIGTHMAYGHGRLFITVPAGAIAPKVKVNLTATTLTCTVVNGGGGYNTGNTQTYTGSSTETGRLRPKLTYPDGTTETTGLTFSIVVTRGIVTSVSISKPSNFTDLPTVTLETLNQSGQPDSSGSFGSGASVTARLTPTTVASITVTTPGSGFTLTPTVRFDNTGTGGTGAAFTVTRTAGTDTLTFNPTSGGTGYTSAPRVIFEDMGGNTQEIVASDIAYGGSNDFIDIDSSFSTGDGTAILLSQEVPFKKGEAVTIENHSSFPAIDGTWAVSSVGVLPQNKRGVSAVVIEDQGFGYRSAPTVTIDPPPEGGRRAKAKATTEATIGTVRVGKRGSGYKDTAGGDNINVVLVDDWAAAVGATFETPSFQVILGSGVAVDKVKEDQFLEVRVEDGGGPYVKGTKGRRRGFNPYNGQWQYLTGGKGANAFTPNAASAKIYTLPVPPRLRVEDQPNSGDTAGGVYTTTNGKTGAALRYVYRKGVAHAALGAVITQALDEVSITDSGEGYRSAPNVELFGGKPTEPAVVRAVLDATETNNSKAFTIPALIATEGVGGRIRRALAGTFEDIFNFTETTYLAEGGGFNVSSFVGRIAGIFFLPVANSTSGRGDLVVLGDKGAVTMSVSSPRSEWKDMAFIRVILSETGAVSEKAYTVAQGDVFFYSSEGLRNYRNAKTGEVDGSVTPLDSELYGLIGVSRPKNTRLAYFDNRVFFLTSPSSGNTNFRAMAVLDWASSYAGSMQARPAWDGFWFAPGQDPRANTITQHFLDIQSASGIMLLVCTDGVYKVNSSLAGDKVTNGATETTIKWVVESRAIDFDNPAATKRLLRASVWLQDASGSNRHSLYWRTENRPNWATMIVDQEYTSSGRYAYRLDIPVSVDTATATSGEFKVGVDRGQAFQFRFEGEGKLRFVKTMLYSVPVVESQYGVAKTASAVTITPTGTAEPYPI